MYHDYNAAYHDGGHNGSNRCSTNNRGNPEGCQMGYRRDL